MFYFLSRPPWDDLSGPSWSSGCPWTSWEVRPRWLSRSLPLNPAGITDSELTSKLTSLTHLLKTFGRSRDFSGCDGFFCFVISCFSSPAVMQGMTFLVNSHYVFQNHEMTLFFFLFVCSVLSNRKILIICSPPCWTCLFSVLFLFRYAVVLTEATSPVFLCLYVKKNRLFETSRATKVHQIVWNCLFFREWI